MSKGVETFEEFVKTLSQGGVMNASFEVPEETAKSEGRDGSGRMVVHEAFLKGITVDRAQRWLDSGLQPKEERPINRDNFPLEVAIPKPESSHRFTDVLQKVPGLRPILRTLRLQSA